MPQVLISLGSNINREVNLPLAVLWLSRQPGLELSAVSPVYESAAVGGSSEQAPYFNAAVLAQTEMSPAALKRALLEIEARLGRVRQADKYAARTIDLDIAMYGLQVIDLEGRHIPDPDIACHPHVAVPLADLAPDWVHPELHETLKQLAGRLHTSEKELAKRMDTRMSLQLHEAHYATDIEAVAGEVYDPQFESLIEQMLLRLGEDPEREGLKRTPLRVAKALDFLTSGYRTDLNDVVNDAIFDYCCEEMVIVKDIEFYSMCEHHVLPFFGRAHVAYIPDGKIIGLSKVARVVDMFARRLQVQERLTSQIADAMMEVLTPLGAGVIIEASHFCMMMRGVSKQNSHTVTSAMRGSFQSEPQTRAEFLQLVGR